MIDRRKYDRIPERDWIGTRVKLEREVATRAGVVYPKGSTGRIVHKFKGFEIEGDPCKCCGVALRITKVNPFDLTLIEEDGQ